MQFTGLHDKNGKEIYEGDIVINPRIGETIGVVEYRGGAFGWNYKYRHPKKEQRTDFFSFVHAGTDEPKELEVIGNIYENPELIK